MKKYLSVTDMNDIHQRLTKITDKCLEFMGGATYPSTREIAYNEDPRDILTLMQNVEDSINELNRQAKDAIKYLYGKVPDEVDYTTHQWVTNQREKYKIVNAWYIWIELVEALLNKWGLLYDKNNEIIVDINGEKIIVRSGE